MAVTQLLSPYNLKWDNCGRLEEMNIGTQEATKEMECELQRIKPIASKVIVDIYNKTKSKRMKNKCAYTLVTRLNDLELLEAVSGFNIDVRKLIMLGKSEYERIEESSVTSKINAQKRRHDKRKDFALTKDEWRDTLLWFGSVCAYCGCEGKMTFDHVHPFSKGGGFEKSNIVPACVSCNSSKQEKDIDEWYPVKSFYSYERRRKIDRFINENNQLTLF